MSRWFINRCLFALFLMLIPALLMAQEPGDVASAVGLPLAVISLVNMGAPFLVQFINEAFESKLARWLIPFLFAVLTGAGGAWYSGAPLSDAVQFITAAFTSSQAAYRMIWKPMWDRG